MKNKKTNAIKLGILLLSIVLVFQNCQNEDVNTTLPEFEGIENLNLKTVSFTEAKSFFNTYNNQRIKERKSQNKTSRYSIRATQQPLELSPNWDSIAHNDLYGIDQAQLTLTDVEVNRRGNYISKLFFVEQDGKIESAIFTIYQDVVEDDGRIVEATIYLNGLDGTFVDGYRIEGGRITKRLVAKKDNIQKAAFFMFMQEKDDCWNTDSLIGVDEVVLEEVTVTGGRNNRGKGGGGGSSGQNFGRIVGISTYYMEPANYSSNYYGGGGGTHSRTNISSVAGTLYVVAGREKELAEQEKTCPDGYAKDTNGNCVKRPCKGDPIKTPEIAPQLGPSGIQGGMHDTCARWDENRICKGVKGRKWHNGVDLKNPYGAPVYAIYGGVVTKHEQRDTKTGILDGAGYYSVVESKVNGKSVRMVYFHLQDYYRKTGTVKAGDVIGYQGVSGNLMVAINEGYAVSHVHIKTQVNGKNDDPLNHIKTKINTNTGQLISNCQ